MHLKMSSTKWRPFFPWGDFELNLITHLSFFTATSRHFLWLLLCIGLLMRKRGPPGALSPNVAPFCSHRSLRTLINHTFKQDRPFRVSFRRASWDVEQTRSKPWRSSLVADLFLLLQWPPLPEPMLTNVDHQKRPVTFLWGHKRYTSHQSPKLDWFFLSKNSIKSPKGRWDNWPVITRLRVGVTKPISSVPLFSEFFSTLKTNVGYWISRLYLADVAAAQLRWHLSNMNVIRKI